MEDHATASRARDFGDVTIPDLPGSEDRMFSDGHADWWNNACLMHGWGDRWYVYARGYHLAADIAVERVDETACHQDYLVYPVMFLYRHYLELAIKGLIINARTLLGESHSYLNTHSIPHWWCVCRSLLERIRPNDADDTLGNVGRLIDQFCEHDPGSFAFRYPVDKDGKPTLAELPDRINLRNAKDVMGRIECLLDGFDTEIKVLLDYRADALAEFAEEERAMREEYRDDY